MPVLVLQVSVRCILDIYYIVWLRNAGLRDCRVVLTVGATMPLVEQFFDINAALRASTYDFGMHDLPVSSIYLRGEQ